MATYDPDKTPQADLSQLNEAIALGLFSIAVVCDERGAKAGDHTGVSFVVYVNVVPRIGERITLEDGGACEVRRVYYKTVRAGRTGFVTMMPTVYAVRLTADSDE